MDMMTIRKMVMAQMASGSKVKSGSFTGSGINASLNIGFEPDIVIVTYVSGNLGVAGMQQVVIVKGVGAYNSLWYGSNLSLYSYGNYITENDDPWGAKSSYLNYESYAIYSDGTLTISNASAAGRCFFVSGKQYSWTAIKC